MPLDTISEWRISDAASGLGPLDVTHRNLRLANPRGIVRDSHPYQTEKARSMIQYDHEETEKIINRLRNAKVMIQGVTVSSFFILFTSTGILLGMAIGGSTSLLFGFAGAVIGFSGGLLSVFFLSAVIEWLCQMLIVQGELIETFKRGRKSSSRE